MTESIKKSTIYKMTDRNDIVSSKELFQRTKETTSLSECRTISPGGVKKSKEKLTTSKSLSFSIESILSDNINKNGSQAALRNSDYMENSINREKILTYRTDTKFNDSDYYSNLSNVYGGNNEYFTDSKPMQELHHLGRLNCSREETFLTRPIPFLSVPGHTDSRNYIIDSRYENYSMLDHDMTLVNHQHEAGNHDEDDIRNNPHFDWLYCTRYKPPKITRAKRRQGVSERASRQPRIPFTPYQQTTLEKQFQRNQYLTTTLLNILSQRLNLTKQRIKVWYQNRRARDRREELAKGEND
ncbi:uncharacterized protein [Clytia hemisphaerica]|uniref:Homeobox domain-containing protein n=1 Tax=Clytia hemisphaerica TaxID=252671 RepID=A0A7M5X4L5_9CNID